MVYLRRANERGQAHFGWLHSQHSFSFGSYYDAAHMGVSVLRVINDDVVAPGAGFDTHGHKDMEIVSYVVSGALEHQDSTGNRYVIPAGEVQLMSAGKGIYHSEYNASKSDSLNFLQIWIRPNVKGIAPSYQQCKPQQTGMLTPLVTPDGVGGSLQIHQDASIYRVRLQQEESVTLEVPRLGYLHVVHGDVQLAELTLSMGDGIALPSGQAVTLRANSEFEALWFDLPVSLTE
ncbi:pirin family protein [Pseudoalteromonas fenneropenaei]|uniref:Pirin family protein n=1 Tax=Pseudoalteromonas fenneropenaei TaxID=1737459 RepID=A0ABV7CJF6_9GAMM